jgi:hypothetical protein
MFTRKNVDITSENINGKVLANFRKMLTKNVANTPKSVDKKIDSTFKKC